MALIPLSDWIDRFGDVSSRAATESDLESLRIVVEDVDPARASASDAAKVPRLRRRWFGLWQRMFWRLRGRAGRAA